MSRYPSELSGGELQRYSVLRSLNPKTKFLIADEMTTMLDAVTQVQILDSVIKIIKKIEIPFSQHNIIVGGHLIKGNTVKHI